MVKQLIFLSLLIFISNAYSVHLNAQTQTEIKTNSHTKYNPNMGCTISLKKKKHLDRAAAISFISEVQSSLGKFKHCKQNKIYIKNTLINILKNYF